MGATAEINLLPKQTEAWDAYEDPEITEVGYGGAAGGGKTRLGWYLAISISEQYPGARGVVGRKELKNLKATTLVELWEIFKELGYAVDVDYTYNDNKSVLRFANGSEIMLVDTAFSPQDPEYTNLGGLPLTWSWLDESNETPEKAKAILKTRVGRMNKFHKGRVVSSVPEGIKDFSEIKPFWLETFNPNKGHVHRDYYKPWKEGKLPKYRRFIRALPGDNPHLSRAYLENLGRADKATRERLLLGNFDFDSDPTKLMTYDAITDLETNTLLNNDKVKTLIVDVARFGGDKIVLGTFEGKELYALGVYTYQGTDETIKKMREEAVAEGVAFSNILADEDGIGGGVVDNMKGIKGFSGAASPLLVWDYVKLKLVPANFTNFRSQCYFKLADMVNDHLISVKIRKFNTNIEGYTKEQAISDLFEELDAIKRKDDSDGSKQAVIPKSEMKEQLGRSPDFADILMMRMYYELKETPQNEEAYSHARPRPQVKVNKAR
jgi:phage terminase large subunit